MPSMLSADLVSTAVGWLGVLFLVGGIILIPYGLFLSRGKKMWRNLIAGGAGVVAAIIIFGMVGAPSLSLTSPTSPGTQPATGASSQVWYLNGNGVSLALGNYPATATSLIRVHLGPQCTACASNSVGKFLPGNVSGGYAFFNASVFIGGSNTQLSVNYIATVGAIPSVTNTTNSAQTGPVVANTASSQPAVTLTVGSTSYTASAVVSQTLSSTKTIAFKVQWSTVLQQLNTAQYPFGFTLSFTFTDQQTGQSYGTLSLACTVNDA